MSKDKCPPRAACVCIGVCVCNVCALKRKEKENGSLKTRQIGSPPVPGPLVAVVTSGLNGMSWLRRGLLFAG